ncbi:hypothetical protein GGH95_004018, partial [Coemansia sp. RSA 1836]
MEGRGPLIASAIVCQYCSKPGHTADKCHAISKLKGEQSSDGNSGSSSSNSRELFTELQGYSGEIMTMSGDSVAIKGRGTASIGKGCNDIGIDNVLYTPDA